MRLKHLISDNRLILIIAAAFLCLVAAAPVMAQDNTDPEPQEETSYFNNAAQAAKASNLAEISAEMANDKAQEDYNNALSDFEAADTDAVTEAADKLGVAKEELKNEDLSAAVIDGTITEDEKAAVENYIEAESALSTAEGALANAAGVSEEDIANMRAAGMGWGEIAHELGIHPSALGLGNKFGHQNQNQIQNRNRNKEMASYGYGKKAGAMSSTMRDLKTGGNAYGKSKSNQGQGNGAAKANGLGQSSGKSNNAGGKGNSGNNGNNGKGKGNDKD